MCAVVPEPENTSKTISLFPISNAVKIDAIKSTSFGLEKYFASPSNFSIIFDATRPSLNFILVND